MFAITLRNISQDSTTENRHLGAGYCMHDVKELSLNFGGKILIVEYHSGVNFSLSAKK